MYGNEEEVGKALRESGLARGDVYITTKYSGVHGFDIETSIHNSLKMVCVRQPLHLSPTANDGIYGIWKMALFFFKSRTMHASRDVLYSLASNTWTCT